MDEAGPVPKPWSPGFGPDPVNSGSLQGDRDMTLKLGGIGPEAAPSLHPGALLWRRSSTRCTEHSVAFNSQGDPGSTEARGDGGVRRQ